MSRYTTRIQADKALYPVLLSNGNLTEEGDLEGRCLLSPNAILPVLHCMNEDRSVQSRLRCRLFVLPVQPLCLLPFTFMLQTIWNTDIPSEPFMSVYFSCRAPAQEGRHYAVWEDPWPKPCYLFALGGGAPGVR